MFLELGTTLPAASAFKNEGEYVFQSVFKSLPIDDILQNLGEVCLIQPLFILQSFFYILRVIS